MSAKSAVCAHGALQVDERARAESSETRDTRRLGPDFRVPLVAAMSDRRQTDAIDSHAFAFAKIPSDPAADANPEAGLEGRDIGNLADRFNQSREHILP